MPKFVLLTLGGFYSGRGINWTGKPFEQVLANCNIKHG